MPTGKNWLNFIYINLVFIIQMFMMVYFIALIDIEKNWPQYRCNPMFMIFSKNISDDFTYCVQNTQINLMGYLLQPFTYLISSVTSIGGEFLQNLDGIRNLFKFIRDFITSIVQNIFSVFQNLIIQFQVIVISLKDMIGKTIGIVITLMYIMDGSIKTLQSAWNGPNGQLVRALGGASCFHPETKCKLQNGTIFSMKDLPLGSILENGSTVFSTMKIDNTNKIGFYKIKNGVNGEDIYVTGTHFIYDTLLQKFVQVKDYKDAVKDDTISSDWFSCLITSDNKIPIGNHVFWDWEDDCLQ